MNAYSSSLSTYNAFQYISLCARVVNEVFIAFIYSL
jgi:hypothetical protein